MDTNELRAKIEALPAIWVDGRVGDHIKRREVLDILDAPPAQPVAVEGMPRIPRYPTEEMMNAGLYQSSHDSTYSYVYSIWVDMFAVAAGCPTISEGRAHPSAAPTGNTALVEAASQWAKLKRESEYRISSGGWDDKDQTLSLFEAEEAMHEAALSQPAAPQPSPEVEALVYERDRNQASRQWHMEKRKEAEADRDRYKEMYEAALARGSVAEKGER